jgi:CBS domain-containing protein
VGFVFFHSILLPRRTVVAIDVGSICQRELDLIGPDDSVATAAGRMRQRTVGSLIVVDGSKHPLGIVTDRDLVIRALADARDADSTPVSEVMTPDIIVATGDTSINSALRLMRDGPFRRLPIVNPEGVLIGLVTVDDMLIRIGREFGEIGSLIELETPAAAAWFQSPSPNPA